jgi:ligand-binding sensor domain-containing protein
MESGLGGEGIGYYDGVQWRTLTVEDGLPDNNVYNVIPDRNGKLWFYFGDNTVSGYDGTSWEPLVVNGRPSNCNVSAFSGDSDGNIWVIDDVEIAWYDGATWHSFAKTENLPPKVFRRNISRDTRGDLWLADWNSLWRYDGKRWQSFTEELEGQTVSSVFSDNLGNVWIGLFRTKYYSTTLRKYIYTIKRFDGRSWTRFDNESFNSMFQDETGMLWFCTSNGLKSYDGVTWRTLTIEDGLANNYVSDIAEYNGIFWIATRGGISVYHVNGN